MDILNFLQFVFIQKAILAGSLIAITCAILGVFLVLKKMSLIGDGLSHISFAGVALGLVLGFTPIYVTIPLVVLGAVAILKISEKARVYGDAAIGIVSAIGISFGVTLASLAKGFNIDLFSYLFGNILAISDVEVISAICLALLVLATIAYFYWDLFATSFDPEFAKASGLASERLDLLLTVLTGLTVAISIKIVGVMLVSALLILPAVTALQFAKGLKQTLIWASGFSVLALMLGLILSFLFDLPSGAAIVLVNSSFLLFVLGAQKFKN